MKTNLTVTVDGELKEKAMDIIKHEMRSTISYQINELLKKIVERQERKR